MPFTQVDEKKKKRKVFVDSSAEMDMSILNTKAMTESKSMGISCGESSKKSKKRKSVKIEGNSDTNSGTSSEHEKSMSLKEKEVKEEENPNAVSKFRICNPLMEKLKERGIEALSPMQADTFDIVIGGSDLVGYTRTRHEGKTLAFVLPILQSLLDDDRYPKYRGKRHPSVIVLLPTKELAKQVHAEFEVYGGALGLTSCCFCGGEPFMNQTISIYRGVDVVIGTPDRVKDLMKRKYHLQLWRVKFRVLDEADEMFRMGFARDVELIFEEVNRLVTEVQTLLFSATLPSWVKNISSRFLKSTRKTVGRVKVKASTYVKHIAMPCSYFDAAQLIPDIIRRYSSGGRTIVFCERNKSAKKLTGLLPGAWHIHGDIQQSTREVALSGFRSGKFMTLVATNAGARGLVIKDVQLIIQCKPPIDVEAYIRRSRHTSRAGNTRVAVMLYDPRKHDISKIQREAGVVFEHVCAPPMPADIARAVGVLAAESLTGIPDNAIQQFKSAAEDLVKSSCLSATELLAKALAKAAGYADIKSRSLLTCRENYVTLLLEVNEVHSPDYAVCQLKTFMPKEKVDSIKGLSLTTTGAGAVFDVATKDLNSFLAAADAAFHDNDSRSLTVLDALPPVLEEGAIIHPTLDEGWELPGESPRDENRRIFDYYRWQLQEKYLLELDK